MVWEGPESDRTWRGAGRGRREGQGLGGCRKGLGLHSQVSGQQLKGFIRENARRRSMFQIRRPHCCWEAHSQRQALAVVGEAVAAQVPVRQHS